MSHSFSVLLSVYKNEKSEYLKDALESISIKQSIQPSEIILVKDGFLTPELEGILSQLQKRISYLKVFGYEENQGLGFALNFGLKKCTNELVFRMDTDDIAHPKRFELQLKYLKDNPDISIIGSTIEEFWKEPGDIKQYRRVPLTCLEIDSSKLKRCPFNHMTVLFKKSAVEEVGGYLSMPNYEDFYLWIRLLSKYQGLNIPLPLVSARIGNDMIGRRQGFVFFVKEISFQSKLYNDKLIPFKLYLRNCIVRGIPRLLPKFILKKIYKKYLRHKSPSTA